MTRKHFIIIAEAIRTANVSDTDRRTMAESMASALRATNPNFDRARFIAAATA